MTQDNLYTLNQGTYEVLENVNEPITLRLFFSDKLSRDIPPLREYGQRVRELIEEYVANSKGMIILERVDPEPFTDNEDLAMVFGLQGMPLSQAGEKFYFGLVASNSTDDISVISYFDQTRESYLEYDLSRIINDLANPKKQKLGMLSSLPIGGGLAYPDAPASEFVPPWVVYERLRELFEIKAREIGMANPFEAAEDVLARIKDVLEAVPVSGDFFPDLDNPFASSMLPDLVGALNNQLPPLPNPFWRRVRSWFMSSGVSRSPAGIPSNMVVTAGPCDSPAVSNLII